MSVLEDKQYKSYNYFSRYTSFPYYFNSIDKKYIYGVTSQLSKDSTYALHKVTKTDTIDSIALYYYNNPTFFWVICDFNNIQDPYIKLEEGTLLKIPTMSELKFKEI